MFATVLAPSLILGETPAIVVEDRQAFRGHPYRLLVVPDEASAHGEILISGTILRCAFLSG
jgi:hypothetical protein